MGFLLDCWPAHVRRATPLTTADLQDYVIVHELLHLHVHNHGKLWKSLMRGHLGDYEPLERRLKQTLQKSAVIPAALAD